MESNNSLLSVETSEWTKGSTSFVNEVQRVTIRADGENFPTGTFVLTIGNDQTSSLAANVSAAVMEKALEQLPSVRGTINVDRDKGSLSWKLTFTSPGPQELISSPCERTISEVPSTNCLLKDASVEIQRVVRGSSPVSGTYRLQLIPADADDADNPGGHQVSNTAPLPVDATANELQEAINRLSGGERAIVAAVSKPRREYGFDWIVRLNDNGTSKLRVVDVYIDGPGPWCTNGITGPAVANTPCVLPFTTDKDGHDVHFSCADAVGPSPGWCSTSPFFDSGDNWGGCARCNEATLASPTIHVAPVRRSFHLRDQGVRVSRALSEIVYHPRADWNAWLGGHDEVTASWFDVYNLEGSEYSSEAKATSILPVFVVPVNDPPTVTLKQCRKEAYEEQELLLDDADIWDPDLTERPEVTVQVLLKADSGTLAVRNLPGLTFVEGTSKPHTSGKVVVKGPLSTLRKAIQHVYYRPLNSLNIGAAARRATQEVQRLELTAPLLPMIQSITTSATKGYIEGNFTLNLNCRAFLDAVDVFFPDVDSLNRNSSNFYVSSPTIGSDAAANGNGSVGTGVKTMLRGCIDLALDRADSLTQQLNTTKLGDPSLGRPLQTMPHHSATAFVSRGEPDLHGGITWVINLVDVPQSFPAFELKGSHLTGTGRGLEGSPYTYDTTSDLAENVHVSIAVVQNASPLNGPSGTFTLAASQGGEITESISADASAEDVAAALATLDDVGAVQVSGGPLSRTNPAVSSIGRYWEVTFLRSGSPIHVGDVQSLEVNGTGLVGRGAIVRVSEVTKGHVPSDFVAITVNDLGNFGKGGTLQATAEWEIVVVSKDVAPVVHVDRTTISGDFLRAAEGTVLPLPTVRVSHSDAWEDAGENVQQKLQCIVRLSCVRGSVKPSPSSVGHDLVITAPSTTVTRLSGSLRDVNRALASLEFYAPGRYRGVDNVEIAARLDGLGVDHGWGTTTLYVFVDRVNKAPEVSAPRWLKTRSAGPILVGGISVADDNLAGNITVRAMTVHGTISLNDSHRLWPSDGSLVRRWVDG